MTALQALRTAVLFALLFLPLPSISNTFSGLDSTTLEPISSEAGEWGLKIVVFDVGQADAILLLAPNGDVAAIDTGKTKKHARKIADYLDNARVNGVGKLKTINQLYSTHYDRDHIGGLRLNETINGKPIFSEYYEKYLKAVGDFDGDSVRDTDERNFVRHRIEHGDTQFFGSSNNVEILCVSVRGDTAGDMHDINLDPKNGTKSFDENPGSIALLVRLGEFEFYTAGDQTSGQWKKKLHEIEEAVLDSGAIPGGNDIDVLKVSHHGSDTSTGTKLAEQLLPEVAIISTEHSGAKLPKKIVLKQLEDNRSYVLITGNGKKDDGSFADSSTKFDDSYTPSTSAIFNCQGDITILVSPNGDRYTVNGNNFSKTFSALDCDNVRSEADNANEASDSTCEKSSTEAAATSSTTSNGGAY